MQTSDLFLFDLSSEYYPLPSEETALPLILVNLQDSFDFLIEQVNPISDTV